MNLEQQVTSLRLCKRLKELGVKQDGLFYWVSCDECNDACASTEWFLTQSTNEHPKNKHYSAFTVGELGVILQKCEEKSKGYKIDYYTTAIYFNIIIMPPRFIQELLWHINEISEANARAQAIIYFLENKLIDAEELNK